MMGVQSLADAALGALLGACVGDAAGAVLEFMDQPLTSEQVQRALTMPGGGVWGVAPGQITDDGELMLCLAQALASSATFDLEAIARCYAAWIASPPFDIGMTTSRSLGAGRAEPSYAATMTQAAARFCLESKSNGSLMRAAPLGVWGHARPVAELADYARQDSCLSHPNPSCWQAVVCYVIAIAHLLNHRGDRHGAFRAAQAWARTAANTEVQGWLADAAQNLLLPYEPQIGFVRIGFTHAFRHLLLGTDYVAAVRETLAGGGDTDTNACIVGGLIGAADGAASIPLAWRTAVLTCDTQQGRARPAFLHPQQISDLVDNMLKL
ncbi:MAG: ADP-ribosylglycohydrolase family protein [Caldilineaceae bacterium]|nr:ADP-ribosylglycohydrolase family protein [Caldilineaceae bacterium]